MRPMMIDCPVCNTPNHHLAITCISCGSFVQQRVENLDLFSVCWRVIEQPSQAFRDIAIARHKNYAILISAVAGIGIAFLLFWGVHAGDYTDSILSIMAAGLVTGPIVGILSLVFLAAVLTSVATVAGVPVRFRNSFAVIAYALLPLVFLAVASVPIELLSFGIYFYSSNPSPYVLKPVSYILILGMHGVFIGWSLLLIGIGTKALLSTGWIKTLVIAWISVVLLAGLLLFAAGKFHSGIF